MVDYTKTQHISSMNASSTTSGVKDGTDKMHSGLLKALELAAAGTAVLEYGSSVFRQVAGSTRTQFSVTGAITYMREGLVSTATPNAVELSSDPDTTHDRYDMIVIQVSDGHFAVREGTAASTPRVADNLTAGDIPVALVKVAAGASSTKNAYDREVQLYGFDKATNSLSIGYNSSGYTETMSIYGDATRTVFKNKIGSADIRFILANNTANEKFEILSDDDSDGDEGDTTVFSVDGLGATTVAGTLTLSSVAAAGTDTDKFLVLDSGGNVDYRTGTQVLSDIGGGTSNVAALNDLSDVSYSSGDLTITSLDKVVFANGANSEISVATTGSGTAGKDLTISAGSAPTGSANLHGGDLILNAGGGDGTGTSAITFSTKVSGTDAVAERMRIHTNGFVGIGENAPEVELHVKGTILAEDPSSTGTTDHILEVKSGASNTADNARILVSADTDIKLASLALRDIEANNSEDPDGSGSNVEGTYSFHYSSGMHLDRGTGTVWSSSGSAHNDLVISSGYSGKDIHFATNAGDAGVASTIKATISDAGNFSITGDLTVSGNDITFGNGATIVNTSSSLLTITEATTAFAGDVTSTGSVTAPDIHSTSTTHKTPLGAAQGGGLVGAPKQLGTEQVQFLYGVTAGSTGSAGTGNLQFFYLPDASGAPGENLIITLKNIGKVDVTIMPQSSQSIDAGSNPVSSGGGAYPIIISNAFDGGGLGVQSPIAITAANTITLPTMRSITFVATTDGTPSVATLDSVTSGNSLATNYTQGNGTWWILSTY